MNAKKATSKHCELVIACDQRLQELNVGRQQREDWVEALLCSGGTMLRQRKPGTKRKYRSMMLYPNRGWTLNDVRRMLDKPW